MARGKAADLVILDADPLRDIRNTARVDSVVTRGRLITREQRLRMLAEVEKAAEQPTVRIAASHLIPAGGCLSPS